MLKTLFKASGNTLTVIPLMLFPMLAYLLCGPDLFDQWLMHFDTAGGATVHLSWGDALISLSLITLALEMVKATSTGARGIGDLVLSVMLLCGSGVLFILVGAFGSATFLILVLMQALDVIAGVVVSVKVARRDIGIT